MPGVRIRDECLFLFLVSMAEATCSNKNALFLRSYPHSPGQTGRGSRGDGNLMQFVKVKVLTAMLDVMTCCQMAMECYGVFVGPSSKSKPVPVVQKKNVQAFPST